MTYLFSIAARDELWSGGVLIGSRVAHGQARCRGREIDAVDVGDASLIERAESRMEPMRNIARELRDARVRLVASARRVNDYERDEASMSITVGGVSIVTTPEHALHDLPSPRRSGERVSTEGLPVLWGNGSAAVLLHEAAGHAAEHNHEPLDWPSWLTIHDEPDFEFDDAGVRTRIVDLTKESPGTARRESFRDVALPRMTNLVVRQTDAPWFLPLSDREACRTGPLTRPPPGAGGLRTTPYIDERIEVHLVAGGGYEPLTGIVTIAIASADLVRGDAVTPLAPFQLRLERERVARSIAGASGPPLRYPGVVCSREGQEVIVGSFAPLMVTT